MKTINYHRLLIAGSVCVILLFFILNIYTPLIADDYSLSLGIHSVGDIFASQHNQYFNWGGRCVAHFLAQFWLLTGKQFFNVTNTIVYCLFIFLVQFHITGKFKKPHAGLFLALNVFFWFFIPAWGQNFLWLDGSCNYLWTTTIILFFLVPFRKKQDNPEYKLNIPLSVSFFLIGILAGWSNENSGAAVLFLLIAYFTLKIINKNKFTLFEFIGFTGFLIGFILQIAAPGNYVRTEVFQQNNWGYTNYPFVLMLIKRFVSVTEIFLRNHGFLLVSISIFLGFDIAYHQKRKLPVFSYFYGLAVLASAYSMIFSPAFPDRAFMIVTVFAVITLGNVLALIKLQLPEIIKRNVLIIAVIALIGVSLSFFNAVKAVIVVYLRWYDRIEYVLAEKEKGNFEIETEAIPAADKHIASYGLADILVNENEWPNTSIAKYFGIKSIKSNNEPPESVWLEKEKRIRQLIIPPGKIIKQLRS